MSLQNSNTGYPTIDPKTSSSLSKELRAVISKVLIEAVPQWAKVIPVDLKKVVSPKGEGLSSISIKSYKGTRSWIGFGKDLEHIIAAENLSAIISKFYPELLGYVIHPGGAANMDTVSLVSCWCRVVEKHVADGLSLESGIDKLLFELDSVLDSESVRASVLSPLVGLRLPPEFSEVELDSGISLRRLSVEELTELASSDALFETGANYTSEFVGSAVEIIRNAPFKLAPIYHLENNYGHFMSDLQEDLNYVIQSLHLVKSGNVAVIESHFNISPSVLPHMSGYSSAALSVHPFAQMELVQDDIDTLVESYQLLRSAESNSVSIACARLVDAEHRLSPVDALLDAIIGLEVLLNPIENSEKTFRVSLNFALLGDKSERMERYRTLKDIQNTRNEIVHGGANLKSKHASKIYEHAELAKKYLREVILVFLKTEILRKTTTLKAEYWLEKMFETER